MSLKRFLSSVLLLIFLVTIGVVNAYAEMNHWYWTMRWFDIPMHFAGGVWLASFGIWLHNVRKMPSMHGFWAILRLCLIFSLGAGIVWELYEAIVGLLTVGPVSSLLESLKDILFDILGGTTVAVVMYGKTKLK